MRRIIGLGAFFILLTCMVGQAARAAPETYDYWGWVTEVRHLDPSVPLPEIFTYCTCPTGVQSAGFLGTLVVDASLPPQQRLLEFTAFETNVADGAAVLEAAPGHPENRVVSQSTSALGIGVPPPHWELVTASGRTAPLPDKGGRSMGMSLQWSGEPGAARQYPDGAQDVDLATLTPRTSWRMTFTYSDGAKVYAVATANVTRVKRRGSGGLNYDEDFRDGVAQGWVPQSGAWSAASGELRNAANTAFTSNTIQSLALPTQFVMLADVYLSWGASGNTAGVVFNYQGPNDFYEIRLNAQGTMRWYAVIGGVRQLWWTNTYPDAGVRRWHTIYIRRLGVQGTVLQVDVNGKMVIDTEFDPTPNPAVLHGGSAGVFASWNLARFDNVLIGAPLGGVFAGDTERFTIDPREAPPIFEGRTGTWEFVDGYMRSATSQAASIALSRFNSGSNYGIAGRIHLEWSGAGNWGGFVYDYVDAQNYREVRVSRTVPGRVGEIVLAETVNGARHEVLRTRRFQSTDSREIVLSLRRENDRTIIHDASTFSNIQVRQAPVTVPHTYGLLAAWNLVRFDDVLVEFVQDQ